MNERTRLLMAS